MLKTDPDRAARLMEEARKKYQHMSLDDAKAQCERRGIAPEWVAAVEEAGRQAGRTKGSWYVPDALKLVGLDLQYENDALGEVCRAAWIAESGEDPFNVKEMVVSGAGAVGIDLE